MLPHLYLLILSALHILIWTITFLGGILSSKVALLNLLVFLPMIFVIQSIFPFHILCMHKLRYIDKHIHAFPPPTYIRLDKWHKFDIQNMAALSGKRYEDIERCFLIMKHYENLTGVPIVIGWLRESFQKSFRNPFEASGLIVIGFIINVFLVYFKHSLR